MLVLKNIFQMNRARLYMISSLANAFAHECLSVLNDMVVSPSLVDAISLHVVASMYSKMRPASSVKWSG